MKNLSELVTTLKESNLKKAKARIKALRKKGKKDVDIIKTIHGEFKGMDSFELLGLMESLTGIPVSEDLVPYESEKLLSEDSDGSSVIFILDEKNGKKFYIEGYVNYKNRDLTENKGNGIVKEFECDLCGSTEHATEDCDKIEEVVKTNPKKVASMCNNIRKSLGNGLNNRDILDMMVEMNTKKAEMVEKNFIFNGTVYNIKEHTQVIKDIITSEDDVQNIYGECVGKFYRVVDSKFQTECSYVNITSFKAI